MNSVELYLLYYVINYLQKSIVRPNKLGPAPASTTAGFTLQTHEKNAPLPEFSTSFFEKIFSKRRGQTEKYRVVSALPGERLCRNRYQFVHRSHCCSSARTVAMFSRGFPAHRGEPRILLVSITSQAISLRSFRQTDPHKGRTMLPSL